MPDENRTGARRDNFSAARGWRPPVQGYLRGDDARHHTGERRWRNSMRTPSVELRNFKEVAIRTEKHPDSAVVIWVVVADDEVFVRSVRGSKGRWYRDLATGGSATLEFAGRQQARRG